MADDRLMCFLLEFEHGDQVVHRHVAISGDRLEAFPKGILNADARLVSGDQDGVYDDERLPSYLHSSVFDKRLDCLVSLLHDEPFPLFLEGYRRGRRWDGFCSLPV